MLSDRRDLPLRHFRPEVVIINLVFLQRWDFPEEARSDPNGECD